MKKSLLMVMLLMSLVIVGCSGGGDDSYGAGVNVDAPRVQVKDVFLNPDLMGKEVTLEGRIVSQCASNGCWFYLQDDTGQIYIDLARHGFALPSLPNRTAIATGTVARSQQAYVLIASGVEVK